MQSGYSSDPKISNPPELGPPRMDANLPDLNHVASHLFVYKEGQFMISQSHASHELDHSIA